VHPFTDWTQNYVTVDICLSSQFITFFFFFFFFPWFHSPAQALASSTKSGWISWRLLNNFLFYRVELWALRPTPIPEDQAYVFISPRSRVATHFSRLLRHVWVTVGQFLFPGHHTGNNLLPRRLNFIFSICRRKPCWCALLPQDIQQPVLSRNVYYSESQSLSIC
jgi:hypothetical protein